MDVTDSERNQPKPPLSLADLSSAYFGLVMATGIVSISAHLLDHTAIAKMLFALSILQYVVLVILYMLRAFRYRQRFFDDLFSHRTGPGFFTIVAGSGILSSQFFIFDRGISIGRILWGMTILLWVCSIYVIFTALTVSSNKPTLETGISGSWLLAAVATQSLSVSTQLMAAHLGQTNRLEFELFAVLTWLMGGMLYLWLISLIFYRYTFFRFVPDDLAPPYWINMGAMAISTLAGALMIRSAPEAPLFDSLLPFLRGVTLLWWATGTWWIPMLLLLGFWRYRVQGFPLEYNPLYWAAVFPLGMYAVCTWQLNHAFDFEFLTPLPKMFFWIALAAWAVASTGLLGQLMGEVRRQFGRKSAG